MEQQVTNSFYLQETWLLTTVLQNKLAGQLNRDITSVSVNGFKTFHWMQQKTEENYSILHCLHISHHPDLL